MSSTLAERFSELIQKVTNPAVYNPTSQEIIDFFEQLLPNFDPSTFDVNETLVCKEVNGQKVLVPESSAFLGEVTETIYPSITPVNYIHVSPFYTNEVPRVQYQTIENAFSDAVTGDVIVVHSGEYTVTSPIVITPAKEVAFQFDANAHVIGDVDALDAEGVFEIRSYGIRLTGRGRFTVAETCTVPMFYVESPESESVVNQLIEFEKLHCIADVSGIHLKHSNVYISGLYATSVAPTAAIVTIENTDASDWAMLNIRFYSAFAHSILMTGTHANAFTKLSQSHIHKLYNSPEAGDCITMSQTTARLLIQSTFIRNGKDSAANNCIGAGETGKLSLYGVAMYCANVDSRSIVDCPSIQSINAGANRIVANSVEEVGTILIDPAIIIDYGAGGV